jgi:hypothetical protein
MSRLALLNPTSYTELAVSHVIYCIQRSRTVTNRRAAKFISQNLKGKRAESERRKLIANKRFLCGFI